MTKRRSMTASKRLRIWNAHSGVCHLCGLPIKLGELWDVEHRKPLWLGGSDDEDNMAPAHKDCHAPKSKEEAGVRAKTNRVAARHLGIEKKGPRIVSRGFEKREKQKRFTKTPLPPRSIYE